MTARLIGIGGRLAAGKDEVANHLRDKHGFTVLGMSDPLHLAAMVINPIVAVTHRGERIIRYAEATEELGYVRAKDEYRDYRDFLQKLGTDFGRDMIGANVWVDIARGTIGNLLAEGRDVVITGLRYPNEIAMIEELTGQTWWVDRTHPASNRALHAHQSEKGVNESDFMRTIRNYGSLEDLYGFVDAFLEPYPRHGVALTRDEVLALEEALHADLPTVPISILTEEHVEIQSVIDHYARGLITEEQRDASINAIASRGRTSLNAVVDSDAA